MYYSFRSEVFVTKSTVVSDFRSKGEYLVTFPFINKSEVQYENKGVASATAPTCCYLNQRLYHCAAVVVAAQTLSRPLAGTDYLSVFPISEVTKTCLCQPWLKPYALTLQAVQTINIRRDRIKNQPKNKFRLRIAVSLFGVIEYISNWWTPARVIEPRVDFDFT